MEMKKITMLAASFLLASSAIAATPTPKHEGARLNFVEVSNDVNLNTGTCTEKLTPYRSKGKPITMAVPCDEYTLRFVPAGKKEAYIRKFGALKKQ
jgi:hypothetical protein